MCFFYLKDFFNIYQVEDIAFEAQARIVTVNQFLLWW